MSTGLLERRSPSSRSFRPPSSAQIYSSTPCVEVTNVAFSTSESVVDNHTERLVSPNNDVIIRRGNTLILKITMSVTLSCSYSVSLTFVPVFRPRERFGQFKAKGVANGSHDILLSIKLPCNFPIGKYHAHLTVTVQGGLEVIAHFHNKPIVVLFNPWDPEDDSYIESENDRTEYLENDVGTIWRGTHKHKVATKWEFGQYEEHCLDVALSLLRDLKADDCRCAAKVCRGVASQITTRDGSGVLVASFTGGHVGGMHPARWSGSPAILQKYHRCSTPVRYGQCWVFAGVYVTLLRCLGIACRPVTCYNAAHYCTKLGQVERYFTTEGELVQDLSRDQLWFYHVWVEAWTRRDDLPSGYDGWQVIDPTSQDKQSGRFRVGPASLEAIRLGRSGKKSPYDAEYVISEVSADVKYLRVSSSHTLGQNRTACVAYVNHSEVGPEIVTSNSDGDLVDVTSSYKDASNVSLVDNNESKNNHTHFPLPTKDCEVKVQTSDTSKYGEPITVHVTIHNKGAFLRTVDGRVTGNVVYYTGQHVRKLLSMQFTGTICPGQNASVSVPIEAKKYMRVLVEQYMMQFFVAIKVRESRQLFLQVHPYQLTLPELEFQSPGKVVVGETFRVKIKFRNILSCSLCRVTFLVQAQALCPQREITHKRLVLPGGLVSVEVCLRASAPARSYTLLASMSCDLLKDVRGSTIIQVVPPPSPPQTPRT